MPDMQENACQAAVGSVFWRENACGQVATCSDFLIGFNNVASFFNQSRSVTEPKQTRRYFWQSIEDHPLMH